MSRQYRVKASRLIHLQMTSEKKIKIKNSGWDISCENQQRKRGFPPCSQKFSLTASTTYSQKGRLCSSPALCHLCLQIINEMLLHQRGLEHRLGPSVPRPRSLLLSSILKDQKNSLVLLCPLSVQFEHKFSSSGIQTSISLDLLNKICRVIYIFNSPVEDVYHISSERGKCKKIAYILRSNSAFTPHFK